MDPGSWLDGPATAGLGSVVESAPGDLKPNCTEWVCGCSSSLVPYLKDGNHHLPSFRKSQEENCRLRGFVTQWLGIKL